MNINELLKEYRKTYSFLYDNGNDATGIIEADYAGCFEDAMIEPEFKEAAEKAAAARGDLFISDRECAAFVIAYKVTDRRERLKALFV